MFDDLPSRERVRGREGENRQFQAKNYGNIFGTTISLEHKQGQYLMIYKRERERERERER